MGKLEVIVAYYIRVSHKLALASSKTQPFRRHPKSKFISLIVDFSRNIGDGCNLRPRYLISRIIEKLKRENNFFDQIKKGLIAFHIRF